MKKYMLLELLNIALLSIKLNNNGLKCERPKMFIVASFAVFVFFLKAPFHCLLSV